MAWQLQEAKAKLSELIKQSKETPQVISCRGVDEVVVMDIKKSPNKKVIDWLSALDSQKLFLSVLTLGEIRKGIEKLEDHSKKQRIIQWLEIELVEKFRDRIVLIDSAISNKWGYLTSVNNMPAVDALIAASAMVFNYKLVTRNVKDFKGIMGLELINPF